jgi:hypothetical protein
MIRITTRRRRAAVAAALAVGAFALTSLDVSFGRPADAQVAEYGRWTIAGPAEVVEGNTGITTVNYTVSTSVPTTAACGIWINVTNGTAALGAASAAGTDYELKEPAGMTGLVKGPWNGVFRSYYLKVPAGTSSFDVPVDIVGDFTDVVDETYSINILSSVLNDGTLGCGYSLLDAALWAVTTTITNDDQAPVPAAFELVGPTAPVVEGNSGVAGPNQAVFTLTSPVAPARDCRVKVYGWNPTPGNTAFWPFDWQYPAGSTVVYWKYLTIPAGSTSFTTGFDIVGDVIDETDELFNVWFSAETDNLAIPPCGYNPDPLKWNANATIQDDDATPAFGIGNAQVVEGNSGRSNMTFTVSSPTSATADCQLLVAVTNGTAGWPWDWTYPAGNTAKNFEVITIPAG